MRRSTRACFDGDWAASHGRGRACIGLQAGDCRAKSQFCMGEFGPFVDSMVFRLRRRRIAAYDRCRSVSCARAYALATQERARRSNYCAHPAAHEANGTGATTKKRTGKKQCGAGTGQPASRRSSERADPLPGSRQPRSAAADACAEPVLECPEPIHPAAGDTRAFQQRTRMCSNPRRHVPRIA